MYVDGGKVTVHGELLRARHKVPSVWYLQWLFLKWGFILKLISSDKLEAVLKGFLFPTGEAGRTLQRQEAYHIFSKVI